MKNKNGFTVVELLVVVSLMLSILGIAIINFVNVSSKKKEDAWKVVKSQIEEAATEYFISNEYLFEGLVNGSSGNITLGRLVDEDYLDRVVDPRNEKMVNRCSYVKVSKNDNSYTSSYASDVLSDDVCKLNNSLIMISEPNGPSLSPVINCKKGNNDWCVSNALINLNISTNNNGSIKDVKKTEKDIELCSLSEGKDTLQCTNEGMSTINVIVTNVIGKSAKWVGNLKIDKTAPDITNVSLKSQKSYNSNLVYGSFSVTDSVSGINYVSSSVPNNKKETKWYKNGSSEWFVEKYSGVAANDLNGSKVVMKVSAEDMAGNLKSVSSNQYEIYKECSKTVSVLTKGTWGSCSKTCGTGERKRTDTITYKDSNTGKICSTKTEVKKEKCNTNPCLSISKISGASSAYCSLRNPWGYSTKSYNENITGNNCRDTNNNPRVIFGSPTATLSGKTASITVMLDIYSTSWEMLATSSNNNNARYICVTDGNKFSTSKCVSNSVEIKSRSSTWKSYAHVLTGKKVTLTVNNVDDYSKLAFKIYSPGKGVNANPTCTRSGTYNCVTSSGTPFIFQSDYLFDIKS